MKSKQLILVSLIIVLVSITGCLERKETIIVNKTGETEITYEIEGNFQTFEKSQSYPTEEKWNILEEKRFTDKDGEEKIKLKATQTLKPKEIFPEAFASYSSNSLPLRFPTELKVWKEGNRTFYRFERTYQDRMFRRFNAPDEFDNNKELEERVLNEGIFNVSEADRNQYIENLSMSIMYHAYATYLEAIGEMLLQNNFPIAKKTNAEMMISEFIEKKINDSIMLHILALDEPAIDSAYDELLSKIETGVTDIISDITGQNQNISDSPFQISLKNVREKYSITEALSADKFSITLQLPGQIVTTNGYTDPEEQGTVYWEFSGEDLHDAQIPLFALSVMEN